MHVHERGDKRLDAVLDFVAFTARPMPLLTLLDEAPRRIAVMLEADVCSLYLLEGDESELVMRGNVGFSTGAIGQVRLRIGEGITGEAVEYMRPITTSSAEAHGAYKHFAELGEERFPAFLAVPIRGKAGPLGALVVQRREPPFEDRDVELLSVLGGLIAAGIRTAELLDEAREKGARRAGGGTRKVTLTGQAAAGRARARGRRGAAPTPDPAERAHLHARQAQRSRRRALADRGLRRGAEGHPRPGGARARSLGLGADAGFLGTYVEILDDARFRERATDLAASGVGLARALSQVARDVTRTAVALTRDAYLEERARDIEDLCDALTMLADNDKRSTLPSKALLVGDTLTVFDLLVSARSQPAGIALSERAGGPRLRSLLKLLNVPAVVDVQGLFRWASDGDIALLDGDHGLLVINPSKGEMASLREYRRSGRDA